eukprot:9497295-Pyramimonas_sp.AAC.2
MLFIRYLFDELRRKAKIINKRINKSEEGVQAAGVAVPPGQAEGCHPRAARGVERQVQGCHGGLRRALRRGAPGQVLGLHTAIKPLLLSHSTTGGGEFNSPPEYQSTKSIISDCRLRDLGYS